MGRWIEVPHDHRREFRKYTLQVRDQRDYYTQYNLKVYGVLGDQPSYVAISAEYWDHRENRHRSVLLGAHHATNR